MKTPYLIYKPEILEDNYKLFESLCKKHFKNFKIAYSVKTNSDKLVIKTLSNLGCGFEVASINEINLIPAKSFMIYNSPAKTYEELNYAIKKNILLNADSKSEIEKIASILNGKPFEIGIRISLKESKFGFDETLVNDIIDYAKKGGIFVNGIHFHPGTQNSIQEYKNALEKFSVVLYFLEKKGIKFDYIDIGGGFPDKFQLKNLNASLEDYLLIVKNYLEKFNTKIIFEPGRFIVGDAFDLITKVIVIKDNFQKHFAILDAGINILPKLTLSTYKFSLINNQFSRSDNKKEYYLGGPLLFGNDIVGKFQGNLKEGDLIKVENVGAYCYNLAMTLSYPKPEIIKSD